MKQGNFFLHCLLTLLCMVSLSSVAQNNADIKKEIGSLLKKIATEKDNNVKGRLYSDLAWAYTSFSADSALHYGKIAVDIARMTNDAGLQAQTLNDYGTAFLIKGDYTQALKNLKQSEKLRIALKDHKGLAALHLKIGNCFYKISEPDSTMTYFLKSLKYYENHPNTENETALLECNIGNLHYAMQNYDKALLHLNRSNQIFLKNKRVYELASNFVNIGNIYLNKRDTLRAVSSYNEALKQGTEADNISAVSSAHNNLGSIYTQQKAYKKAISHILTGIYLREKAGMLADLASSKLSLAMNYNALGEYKKAHPILKECQRVFEPIRAFEKLPDTYLQLTLTFANMHQPDSVAHYLNLYTAAKEKTTKSDILKNTAELETKYQSTKKDAALSKKDLAMKQKNYLMAGIGVLVVLSAVIVFLIIKQQKARNQQTVREHLLKEKMAVVEGESKLQQQRMQISRELHDNIGSYLTFINTSIDHIGADEEKDKNKLQEVKALTSETIAELRRTVWLINKPILGMDEWIVKLAEHYKRIPFVKIEARTEATAQLTANQATSLFRIVQEAVNNAQKYAEADYIRITISSLNNFLTLHIDDQGKGFDMERVVKSFGLNNIQMRAEELKGSCIVSSAPGKGTSITIEAPINT